tara:strand:+ start:629 stop:883 length:255 start_codon:yes stop_codon:yes gene_type:complete
MEHQPLEWGEKGKREEKKGGNHLNYGSQCDSKIQLQSEQEREEVLIIYSITTIFLTLYLKIAVPFQNIPAKYYKSFPTFPWKNS